MDAAEHKATPELVEEIQEERADTLLPYQARWLEDQAKVRIVEKPRRFACKFLEVNDGRG